MPNRRANRRRVLLPGLRPMPTFLGTTQQQQSGFAARIARAEELAQSNSAAAELLRAYSSVASFQKGLHKFLEDCSFSASSAQGLPELDWYLLVPRFQAFLQVAAMAGPAGMQQSARTLEQQGAD